MRRADLSKIAFDGDLSDWDEKYRVNAFMIGPNGDKDPTKIYLAWCKEGLVAALDVDDSRCFVADPNSFWRAADCFEVMMTTPAGVKFKDGEPWCDFDHQLWFCPLSAEKHMFCGYWANSAGQGKYQKELNARLQVKTDMTDCTSCVVKTARGYRAEMLIPGERFLGWDGMRPGAEIGLALTLVVENLKDSQHELYWPNSKKDDTSKKPWTWARVKLAD